MQSHASHYRMAPFSQSLVKWNWLSVEFEIITQYVEILSSLLLILFHIFFPTLHFAILYVFQPHLSFTTSLVLQQMLSFSLAYFLFCQLRSGPLLINLLFCTGKAMTSLFCQHYNTLNYLCTWILLALMTYHL